MPKNTILHNDTKDSATEGIFAHIHNATFNEMHKAIMPRENTMLGLLPSKRSAGGQQK